MIMQHEYAAWKWTYSMDIGHALWTYGCSKEMGMYICKNMDMDM